MTRHNTTVKKCQGILTDTKLKWGHIHATVKDVLTTMIWKDTSDVCIPINVFNHQQKLTSAANVGHLIRLQSVHGYSDEETIILSSCVILTSCGSKTQQ